MSWSWKVGRIAGIPIYIHWTFLILIGWVFVVELHGGRGLPAALEAVGFILVVFGCVVLHELGHALAARRFGVPTADITLLPIGGVARLQRIPEQPAQELVIAVAGPAVNLAIIAVLWLLGVRWPGLPSDEGSLLEAPFLARVMVVNLMLFLFNLLPAFPMDGGRVLRASLGLVMEYGRATRLAASVGQFMAVVFGILGLMVGNPILVFIAVMVWFSAGGEAAMVQERVLLRGRRVREAMLTDFRALDPGATLGEAASQLLAGSQQDFPVLDGGRVAGLLTRSDLINGLAQAGPGGRVADFLRTELGQVEPEASLADVALRLRGQEGPCLVVMDRGRPVGLVTAENLAEFLMIRMALTADGARGPAITPLRPGGSP